jgi:hypothetical protein
METEKGISHDIYGARNLTFAWHVYYAGIDRPVPERIGFMCNCDDNLSAESLLP